jgi:hypothetical protein
VRLVRTGEERNSKIFILAIYCLRAKRQGRQYTKRLLPPFVIPECNITLDNVLRYLEAHPGQPIDYDAASAALGSYDERTLKRHILAGVETIRRAGVLAGELLAFLSAYAHLPSMKVGDTELGNLGVLCGELHEVAQKVSGGPTRAVAHAVFVHLVYVHSKCRKRLATALNRVFREVAFTDTC